MDATPEEIQTVRAKLRAYRTGRTADGQPHPIRSLRQLARELEMSPSGLAKFMDGSAPYTATVRALTEWHRVETTTSRDNAITSVVDALVCLYAPRHRDEVRSRMVELIRELEAACPPEPDHPPAEPHVPVPVDVCDNCGETFPRTEIRDHRRREHSAW